VQSNGRSEEAYELRISTWHYQVLQIPWGAISVCNLTWSLCLTLTSQATHFRLMDDFFPTLTPPSLFIRNQINYKHQANMDGYLPINSWSVQFPTEIRMCLKKCQGGQWSCFCFVGSSFEGVDSNQCLLLQCKLCMNIKAIYFRKSGTFFMFMWTWPLCSHWLYSLTF
jgi:hypothetical protein